MQAADGAVRHPPGWDDGWSAAAAVAADAVPGARGRPDRLRAARVARADRGGCELLLAGPRLVALRARWSAAVLAQAAGDPAAGPATGDWVLAGPDGTGWSVHAVLPRRVCLRRAAVAAGSSRSQVLAANVDAVAVVEPLQPEPRPARVERLLALAWDSGAEPLVVLTKADLAPDAADLAAEVAAVAPGCEVLVCSAARRTGLDPLRGRLAAGATVALLGASGVGKSTLLNALAGTPVAATRGVRADGKGRHTTSSRELHPVGAGAVLDTPGLRGIGLPASAAPGGPGLAAVFTDVDDLAAGCRFGDCSHTGEPGCAVLAAVASGRLPARRLESWRRLQREAAHRARRADARLRAEHARTWARLQADARRRSRPGRGRVGS